MSKKDIRLPILLKYKEDNLLLLEIICDPDGSIYFSFPRKKGFVLDRISEKKFYKSDYIETSRAFMDACKKYVNPKISFHPGKMRVHINAGRNVVKYDYEILNIGTEGLLFCYLLQIVLPSSFDLFDVYRKERPEKLTINEDDSLPLDAKNISLEFFIHSSSIEPTMDALPRGKRYFYGFHTFYSPYDYTITMAVCKLAKESTLANKDILVNLNTKDKSVMYFLKPLS